MSIKKDVGMIIQCRYNSTRLPGKILIKIKEKEVLKYIVERLSCTRSTNNIIIATSTEQDDDIIAEFCKAHDIRCFRGHKDDVAKRLLACAENYGFGYFVRICGDNIFADYRIVDEMVGIAIKGGHDLVSNLKERSFPKGISVEVLKTDFFRNIISRFKTDADKEHVTAYLYAHESEMGSYRYFYNNTCPDAARIKLALDDENDLRFISALIDKMDKNHTQYLLKDIYELSKQVRCGVSPS